MADEVQRLKKLAEQQGWRVEKTGGNHLRFTAPDGKVVVTASTPSDSRGPKNALAALRKAGLKDEPGERTYRRPPELVALYARLGHALDALIQKGERFTLNEVDAEPDVRRTANEAGLDAEHLHLQTINIASRSGYERMLWKAVGTDPFHRPLRVKGSISIFPSKDGTTPRVPSGCVAVPFKWNKQRIADEFSKPTTPAPSAPEPEPPALPAPEPPVPEPAAPEPSAASLLVVIDSLMVVNRNLTVALEASANACRALIDAREAL